MCFLLAGAGLASYADEQELHRCAAGIVTSRRHQSRPYCSAISVVWCSSFLVPVQLSSEDMQLPRMRIISFPAHAAVCCACPGKARLTYVLLSSCRPSAVDIPFSKEEGSHHLEGGYALVSWWYRPPLRSSSSSRCRRSSCGRAVAAAMKSAAWHSYADIALPSTCRIQAELLLPSNAMATVTMVTFHNAAVLCQRPAMSVSTPLLVHYRTLATCARCASMRSLQPAWL
jgi:hypothetical protein